MIANKLEKPYEKDLTINSEVPEPKNTSSVLEEAKDEVDEKVAEVIKDDYVMCPLYIKQI